MPLLVLQMGLVVEIARRTIKLGILLEELPRLKLPAIVPMERAVA
jgi:hypothetical protein